MPFFPRFEKVVKKGEAWCFFKNEKGGLDLVVGSEDIVERGWESFRPSMQKSKSGGAIRVSEVETLKKEVRELKRAVRLLRLPEGSVVINKGAAGVVGDNGLIDPDSVRSTEGLQVNGQHELGMFDTLFKQLKGNYTSGRTTGTTASVRGPRAREGDR